MSITVGQVRAARGLIGWSQEELARQSKVGRATIADFESGKREPYGRTLDGIIAAFEAAGVEFTNGGQPGVRMKVVIVFGVIDAESGEPCLKGYDKDKIVIVQIDRGVFAREGSAPLRREVAKAAIGKLNEIANRKHAERQTTGDLGPLVITEADISLAGDVRLGQPQA